MGVPGLRISAIFADPRMERPSPRSWKVLFSPSFDKSHLTRFDRDYLARFILETCRAELAHVLPFLFYPLCLLWNPWPANLIMFLYAVLANVPFILIQRYNRARLLALQIFTTRN